MTVNNVLTNSAHIDPLEELEKVYAEYEADPVFDQLRKYAKQIVKGDGPIDPLVVFVGEAPGGMEDKEGRPFVGPAGKYFDELLASIDLAREDVFVTNVVKYRPVDHGKNRPPTYGEIINSKRYLDRELALLDCKIIVPLGKHSLSVFLPEHTNMRDIHGRTFERDGKLIIPQYHPAVGGIYNKSRFGPIMLEDFKQIALTLDAAK